MSRNTQQLHKPESTLYFILCFNITAFQIQASAYEMSELSDKALIVRKIQALYCIIPTRECFFSDFPTLFFSVLFLRMIQ
jgi:hypothetical protein